MTTPKRLLLVLVIILVVGMGWLGVLYSRYGKQTLLSLVGAPPEVLLSYSKGAVEDLLPARTDGEQTIIQGTSDTENPLPPITVPTRHRIASMSHMYQKLNNCGPSTASMAASTLGVNFDQFFAADILKGSYYDKNVAADELAAFLRAQGLGAQYRINGTASIVEQLVSQNIPVIVEQWLVKRGGELTGHYRVVRGYDQSSKLFTTNDSFNGPNFTIPYTQFEEWWRPFTRGYVVVYKLEQETLVKSILGKDWDETQNRRNALQTFQSEASSIGDGYAHFNVGTAANLLGQFPTAKAAYDQAFTTTFPEHFLWYQFGPLETYYNVGQYDRVMQLSDTLLSQAGEVEEAYYFRGLTYQKQGKTAEARAELEKAVKANPRYLPAVKALEQL
jgi:tetratricopeptide (TPR) repeat protein